MAPMDSLGIAPFETFLQQGGGGPLQLAGRAPAILACAACRCHCADMTVGEACNAQSGAATALLQLGPAGALPRWAGGGVPRRMRGMRAMLACADIEI